MNKCGDCKWLVTSEGKPYYCAIKDLYTLKEADDDACEEFLWTNNNVCEECLEDNDNE